MRAVREADGSSVVETGTRLARRFVSEARIGKPERRFGMTSVSTPPQGYESADLSQSRRINRLHKGIAAEIGGFVGRERQDA